MSSSRLALLMLAASITMYGQQPSADQHKPDYTYSRLASRPLTEHTSANEKKKSEAVADEQVWTDYGLHTDVKHATYEVYEKSDTKIKASDAVPEITTELGVSNNPIVYPLESLYKDANLEMPPDLRVLADQHALYLVELDVHVIPGAHEKIQQVAFKATYDDDSITTLRLFPTTEWQTRFGVGFNGDVQISPALDFFPASVTAATKDTHLEFIFHFGYQWKYPVVISAGVADKFCQWMYDHRKSELAGDIPLYVIIQADKLAPSTGVLIKAGFVIKVQDQGTHVYYSSGHPRLALGLPKTAVSAPASGR